MTQQLIDLKADFAFKQIFAREGNEAILIAFLNSILQFPPEERITSLTLQNPELPRISPDHKTALLDLLVKTEKNVYINVEMQFSNSQDIVLRMLWYWSRLFSEQLRRGEPSYKKLRKTITITLLNFPHFDETDDFHTCFQLFSVKNQLKMTDLLEMHFVELPKVVAKWQSGDVTPSENAMVSWLLLFAAHEHPELYKELEEIFMQEQDLVKLFEQWDEMGQDPKLRFQYILWQKQKLDENSQREWMEERMEEASKSGVERGIARGIEQGIERAKFQTAKNMLKEGINLADIRRWTGLSIQEMEQLQNELS